VHDAKYLRRALFLAEGPEVCRSTPVESQKYIYLVGGIPTPLKNMKVNEKDYPIYYGK